MSLLGHDDVIFIQVRWYHGLFLPASFFYCSETHKMALPYQANHSRHSVVQYKQDGFKHSCWFETWAFIDYWWSGTSSTAKDSKSYRPYLPTCLRQYGWRTNSRRKVESLLFSTQVKDNIRVLWLIKRILCCTTGKMWWKKLTLMPSWTILKVCVMLLVSSLVSRGKCTSWARYQSVFVPLVKSK